MRRGAFAVFVCALAALLAEPRASSPSSQRDEHAAARFDRTRLARIEALIEEAIRHKQLPGAVVAVGTSEGIAYHGAFGNRALVPSVETMTEDTIFDLASLTKVIATTTSVMILIEEGRVRLNDRVAAFLPDFARYGKEQITVRHLLTHTSGLRPDLELTDAFSGYDTAIARASEELPLAPPGRRFIYSDINFLLLGDIVARVSGVPLPRFAATRIFEPLGMKETMFLPPAAGISRIAPTEACEPLAWPCGSGGATMLRGVVHDPTARRMGGVAGHAGLFGTAADLAVFCRMLLGKGAVNGVRILAPLTVSKMTTAATPPDLPDVRGLGWDIDSRFSTIRGELMPIGSFGHTGFTGTGLWIDPVDDMFVVFLSNRVHPDGKGDVTALRGRISTAAAAALLDAPAAQMRLTSNGRDFGASGSLPAVSDRTGPVLTGIDVLEAEHFERLRGRRIGLVTNQTGRSRAGTTTIDLLNGARDLRLVALFSPEHGIRGILDETVPSTRDDKTGLTIHSLYGATSRPTPAMLEGIDMMVIDLQDVGARFYTYSTTLAYVMEEAAKRKIAVVVLDRPNPINGVDIEGPTLEKMLIGFTGYFPMPVRHAMTLGELARLFNGENRIGADLTVVSMKNWNRDDWFDATGVPWVNPSPNMRNLVEATLYPGIGAIEGTNLSVGRGTDTPFEQVGAPWIDGVALAESLRLRDIPGVSFYPVSFTPTSSKYANQVCQGVFIVIMDRRALRPVRLGLEIAAAIYERHGRQFDIGAADKLLGSRAALARIKAGESAAAVAASWEPDEAKWRLLRAKYLLYR